MERAFAAGMPPSLRPLVLALLAACGGGSAVVSGDLARGADASDVWVLGGPGRAAVESDSFRLEASPADPLDLRFFRGEREVGRMEIRGLEAGDRVRLHGVWFRDGEAHPSRVEADGGRWLAVNGVRMGGAPAGRLDAVATVLAVASDGYALIARPADADLPDLRVVVTPGTRVRTPDGDPAQVEALEFGDSLRVRGAGESGYVVATELVLPRERGGG